MTTEQQRALKASEELLNSDKSSLPGLDKVGKSTDDEVFVNTNEPVLQVEQTNEQITNNDGSIIETLDTAFHNKPAGEKDHSVAGSNRTDYYEAPSQGESDAEEEQDYLKKQQQ